MSRTMYDDCPDCDGQKRRTAKRCRPCYRRARVGGPFRGGGNALGVYSDDAVYTVGRRESIITFGRDKETRSLHCFGAGKDAQIADGLARLGGDDWLVLSRSTPTTILADLHRDLSRSTAWEYAV